MTWLLEALPAACCNKLSRNELHAESNIKHGSLQLATVITLLPTTFREGIQAMINPPPRQASSKKKFYVQGLFIGFLPALTFLLLLFDKPTELLEIFTGISLPDFNDRPLKFPLAFLALSLFFWASFKLYKSGRITIGEQCGLVFIATIIFAVWFWIFLIQLGKAMRGMVW